MNIICFDMNVTLHGRAKPPEQPIPTSEGLKMASF